MPDGKRADVAIEAADITLVGSDWRGVAASLALFNVSVIANALRLRHF